MEGLAVPPAAGSTLIDPVKKFGTYRFPLESNVGTFAPAQAPMLKFPGSVSGYGLTVNGDAARVIP